MKLLYILGLVFLLLNISQTVVGNENYTDQKMSSENEIILFDFTKNDSTNEWIEQSDIVREVGMSKAVFSMQKTQVFSRAILFTLLNPQPNGAGFAGMRILASYNLGSYNNILLKLRGQGENKNYKIILRHKGLNNEPNPTYEQFFTVPYREFGIISLPLKNFEPYYRGKRVNNTESLDKTRITSIGIQVYGGVYMPSKQFGASSLEVDWIKVIE